jgi:hypothetical protein
MLIEFKCLDVPFSEFPRTKKLEAVQQKKHNDAQKGERYAYQ